MPSQVQSAQAPTDLEAVERAQTTTSNAPGLKNSQRYLILFIVSWNTLVVTFLSTSLLVATPEIANDLNTTPELLNVTNAGVLIAMGFSSLLWSPLAEIITRRHSYNAALLLMFVASIGTAVAPNMRTFTAMRVVSGFTGTYFMVAGQTIIADIFIPTSRGKAVGCMQVGSVAGTAVGPCIAGIIVTFSTWRSIYWLQVAMSGLGFGLSLFFIPDIRSEVKQVYSDFDASELSFRGIISRFNPVKMFKVYLRPQVFLADLCCGLLAITQYGLLTSIRHVINPRFNLTAPLVSGLFYLAPGAGFIMGSLLGGKISDRTVKKYIVKRDGLRLPKDRLNSGLGCFFVILPISMLLYAWGLDKEFGGLPLPIIMGIGIGIGLMGAYNGLNTYTAEVFPKERSEVVCSKYVLQYIFGAAASAAIVPLIDAVGIGWAFTIFTFCKLLAGFFVLVIARLAPDTGVWAYKS
ncbi:hypothetical protein BDV12DRAFT_206728 [Aspergillus spectabilis]